MFESELSAQGPRPICHGRLVRVISSPTSGPGNRDDGGARARIDLAEVTPDRVVDAGDVVILEADDLIRTPGVARATRVVDPPTSATRMLAIVPPDFLASGAKHVPGRAI